MRDRPTPASRRAAGVVVVRRGDGGDLFLVLRAYRNWDFPKGEVEEREEPLDAARREAREETGIADLRFLPGTPYLETPPYARGKVARFYVARTDTERVLLAVNEALGRPEHHAFRWLSYQEARPLLVPRLQAVLDWARERLEAAGAGG